ncbi:L-fuconolactonase [Sphingomonas naasensis]|uniref:Hydrolase n=1 Tax=Sphingomonas naasensis TaxID=1344951 RepID=A0A4S1WXB3_9SPHN|nr:amidohydrolase family protein [Sphingomonas naasensis]NIJ19058.1 L-fuconolactonase [Sphingomonas naasensis]TGX46256.1 hydrolase [Sphingomonas naasensis]
MIDAHVHLWRIGAHGCVWPGPDLAAIHRDFDLADFRAAAGEGVEAVLLVQSQEDLADTDWLLGLADPLIAGVVGWVDLAAPDAPARVAALATHPLLRGVRPMVQGRADDWYDGANDAALAAMAHHRLVLDALVQPRHLDSLGRLAARHPDLAIVIDHAAKPQAEGFEAWVCAIDSVAGHANLHCKLSGLVTESAAVADAFAAIWRAFGPERLLWGSDWPVVNLAASYGEWREMARALVPAEHWGAVFGGNARRVYRLEEGRSDGGKGS